MSGESGISEASGPTQDPGGELLRAGVVPGVAVFVVAAVVMLLVDGWTGAVGAVIGGLLAVLALAAGPLVLKRAGGMTPVTLYAAALSVYGGVVLVLALVYAVLEPQDWLNGDATAVGLFASAGASLAGQFLRTRRLRTLVYQDTELP